MEFLNMTLREKKVPRRRSLDVGIIRIPSPLARFHGSLIHLQRHAARTLLGAFGGLILEWARHAYGRRRPVGASGSDVRAAAGDGSALLAGRQPHLWIQ